jgi:primosomal protein N' (replication factor Y)
LDEAAQQLVVLMRKSFGNRVLGPEYPAISRIRNYYHKNVLLKIENNASIAEAKNILNTIIDRMSNHTDFKAIRFILDVDPV